MQYGTPSPEPLCPRRLIAEGHWRETGRSVFREAHKPIPSARMAWRSRLGRIQDDAREARPKLRPWAHSWGPYRWANVANDSNINSVTKTVTIAIDSVI